MHGIRVRVEVETFSMGTGHVLRNAALLSRAGQ